MQFSCKIRIGHRGLRNTEEASGHLRKPGLNSRHPGTQSVCLRQDRGSNRPEKWLNRFLVAEQSGTVWGLLRLNEADLNLIPGFDTDSVFPPILPFSSPTVHD